jgi:hypothetical protein
VIYCLWNVWNAFPRLPLSVGAVDGLLRGEVQHIFVDGRYPEFPGEHDYSTDGTRIFAASAGTLIDAAVDECEKRTVGLRAIDQVALGGDWVLVLDGDEELTLLNLPSAARVGIIRFTRVSDGMEYPRARLYRWEPGLRFERRHLDLFDAEGNPVADLTDGVASVICGWGTHHDVCGPERERAKDIYYRRLQDAEAGVLA